MIQAPCCHARTDIRTRGLGCFIARITSANAAIAAGATETTRFPHFDASEYVLFPIDTAQCAGKGHTSARCRPAAQLVLLGAEFSKNPRGIPRYETGRSLLEQCGRQRRRPQRALLFRRIKRREPARTNVVRGKDSRYRVFLYHVFIVKSFKDDRAVEFSSN